MLYAYMCVSAAVKIQVWVNMGEWKKFKSINLVESQLLLNGLHHIHHSIDMFRFCLVHTHTNTFKPFVSCSLSSAVSCLSTSITVVSVRSNDSWFVFIVEALHIFFCSHAYKHNKGEQHLHILYRNDSVHWSFAPLWPCNDGYFTTTMKVKRENRKKVMENVQLS